MDAFSFKKLDYKDLPLLHRWYNSCHVQAFYAKGPLDFEELESKYKKCLSCRSPQTLFGFICYYNTIPIGYIQYYSVKRHQWLDIDISNILDVAAGIDVFIGDTDYLGKGLGGKMIQRFLVRHIFRQFDYCFVDPSQENTAAIACYKKCGFEEFAFVQSDTEQTHVLLVKQRSSLKKLVHCQGDHAKANNSGNKKNFVSNYIANSKFNWWNKSKNHSSKTRKAP